MLKPITSCEVIEIKVNDLINKRYYFPENLNLRGRKITHVINIPPLGSIQKSPSNQDYVGKSNIGALNSSYITLVDNKGFEAINKLPLTKISPATGAVSCWQMHAINKIIDLPKSYIDISSLTNFSTSESWVIVFLFNENKKPNSAINFDNLHVENIEIPITQNGPTKYNFPDNEKLRGKKIIKIELLGDDNTFVSPLGYLNQNGYFLTLNISGKERVNLLPSLFITLQCFLNQVIFDYVKVDWPKSYIILPATQTNANYAACLQIYYKD